MYFVSIQFGHTTKDSCRLPAQAIRAATEVAERALSAEFEACTTYVLRGRGCYKGARETSTTVWAYVGNPTLRNLAKIRMAYCEIAQMLNQETVLDVCLQLIGYADLVRADESFPVAVTRIFNQLIGSLNSPGVQESFSPLSVQGWGVAVEQASENSPT